jgi:hypothetical protein
VEVTRSARRTIAALAAVTLMPSAALFAPRVAQAQAPSPPPAGSPAGGPAGPGAAPSAGAAEEARAHYSRGVQLYTEGSYDAALVELERANRLAPSYRILYSIGLVQLKLNDYVKALQSFEQYLSLGGAEVAAARKTEVEERIGQLKQRVAIVDINVNVEGADVLIDDIAVGKSPLKPVKLNPGYHKIAASKAGYNGDAKQIALAGADHTTVTFELTSLTAAVVAPVPTTTPTTPTDTTQQASTTLPAPEAPKTRKGVWIGWAVTGALAAGAVVTGVVALSSSSKLSDQVDNQATASGDIASTHDTTVTMALVSDILTGLAVVAGGVSLYLTLTPPKHDAPPASARLIVGPRGAGIAGQF